ncbi:MAG: M42 family peptidase [Anaerolineales bacterium]
MTELQPFLKSLISTSGLSGYENPVRLLIEEAWKPLSDELHVSRVGSLQALKRGQGKEPRPSLLLAAHMDAIGLIVTGVVDEFLHVTEIGGLDPRVLPGQIVTIHGRQDLPGVIVQPPAHLLPPDNRAGPVELHNLLVDAGLTAQDVKRLVRVGDVISFAQPPIEINGEVLAGHSLDNRASVAAITQCLEELRQRPIQWDLWAVATTQEEETFAGAYTSSYQLRPSLAVAIDVTFGSSPGSPGHKSFPLGKGPTLGWGPNIHSGLHRAFKELAERLEIPYSVEVMPRHSGTDAYALQVSAEGVPTMVVSIPLRYMHTAVEMVAMKDIARTGRLLAEFAAGLNEDFMGELSWDD